MDQIDDRLAKLESEIIEIRNRNARVDLEKGWETSTVRKVAIIVLTYFLMNIVFYLVGSEKFYIDALIPTLGYLLSTQSIGLLKGIWVVMHLRKIGKVDHN